MDKFEQASWDVDKNINSNQENVIEWLRNSHTVTATFSQPKFINRVKELAEKFPEEVEIVHVNKDGSIVCHLPLRAIKINLVVPREYTEEEKEQLRKQLRRGREMQSK